MSDPGIILVVTDHAATVWLPDEGGHSPAATFADDAAGLADWSTFARSLASACVRLLVDAAGETLAADITPRVGARDRARYAARKLAQQYPQSPFRALRWAGKGEGEHAGRMKLVLAGLADPQPVARWVEPLLDAGVAIAAIRSVALAGADAIGKLRLHAPRLALVHRTLDDSLRFSYFHDGRLALSRVAGRMDGESLEHLFAREAGHLLDYLASIRQIGFNDRLTLLALSEHGFAPDAAGLKLSERIDWLSMPVADAAAQLKLGRIDEIGAFFVALVRHGGNDYGDHATRRFWRLRQLRKQLYAGSAALLLLGLGGAGWLAWQSKQLDQSTAEFERQTQAAQANARAYKVTSELPPKDERAAVENALAIRRFWPKLAPAVHLVEQAITANGGFALDSTVWQIAPPADPAAAPAPQQQPEHRSKPATAALSPESAPKATRLDRPQGVNMTIKLRPLVPSEDYRTMLARLDNLRDRLKARRVGSEIITYPINIQSDGNIQFSDTAQRDTFYFELQLQLPPPAAAHAKP